MNFWKQFKPKCCSVNLKAEDKPGAILELVENLVKAKALPAELEAAAVEALVAREDLGSTGVGAGVAIPHVKLKGLDRVACSISIHKEGLEWSAIDGEPVSIFFTVLRPERAGDQHDPERHLEMMTWIAKLARERDFRRFAGRAKTKTELVDLLKEMSAV
ncbi:MAG: PTS sugar transporter subunit IIA [Planctomycetes bacterium]|nr:PTS sugar transporter subunit IIA [Planctomycetota bacterium]MCB9905661.1 PTS sugar transporter subunit IIA [Planctomycetota bacterium]